MTTSPGSEALRRLAEQSRTLLGELDHARPELLSIGELNRTLRQILTNQAALLEAIAEAPQRPQIKIRPAKPAELTPLELEDLDRAAEAALDQAVGDANGSDAPTKVEPAAAKGDDAAKDEPLAKAGGPQAKTAGQPPAADAPALNGGSQSGGVAELLAETQPIPRHLCRGFVCDFDNRDRDYDKGLEKLNRWISAGSSGTPFQWRGDHAYLNLKGAGGNSARTYEEQIMARMGFSRRLGRLDVPGLDGDVVVYERPS